MFLLLAQRRKRIAFTLSVFLKRRVEIVVITPVLFLLPSAIASTAAFSTASFPKIAAFWHHWHVFQCKGFRVQSTMALARSTEFAEEAVVVLCGREKKKRSRRRVVVFVCIVYNTVVASTIIIICCVVFSSSSCCGQSSLYYMIL